MNTLKTYIAAILALLLMLASVSAHAEASLTLQVSVKEVQRGGEIVLSGTAVSDDVDVVIKIVRPNQTVFYVDSIAPEAGNYSATVAIPTSEDFAPFGQYQVVAGSHQQTATQTFTVVDPNGGGTDPGDGGDPDPEDGGDPDPGDGGDPDPGDGGGSHHHDDDDDDDANTETETAPPAQEPDTGIPADAGTVSHSSIQPERGADGRYIIGSDTLAQAVQLAKDAVIIELPASADESGTSLEFPAQALKDLQEHQLDVIIAHGNNTVRLPAGAISASDEQHSRIRITLNAVWSDEAKDLVNRSLQSNPDYIPTGVILSVVIQVISGDSVTDIHNLDKPAVVTMKLTDEQEKAISSELAGVYYVNGDEIQYVGGTVDKGTFTFSAEHFSTYTILEYNKSFADLAGHWAEKSVQSLAAKHIVDGVDDRHYEPGRSITRAEFVTMIMRALQWKGVSNPEAAVNPFSDVAAGAYYTGQVAGAASLGIVSGYNGAFRPNDQITREEAAVALVQAARYANLALSDKAGPSFADANEISDWASASVDEAWSMGLMEGDGSRFNPKNSVTRAEVAVMIQRLLANGSL